jgi:UDP-N-acetylglucosamine:LPS N-acetylglucosamine transferase
MIEQRELTGDRLAAEIRALTADAARRRAMSDAATRLARRDAAAVIVDKVVALAR